MLRSRNGGGTRREPGRATSMPGAEDAADGLHWAVRGSKSRRDVAGSRSQRVFVPKGNGKSAPTSDRCARARSTEVFESARRASRARAGIETRSAGRGRRVQDVCAEHRESPRRSVVRSKRAEKFASRAQELFQPPAHLLSLHPALPAPCTPRPLPPCFVHPTRSAGRQGTRDAARSGNRDSRRQASRGLGRSSLTRGSLPLRIPHQSVPHPRLRAQHLRPCRVVLQLVPQLRHVDA